MAKKEIKSKDLAKKEYFEEPKVLSQQDIDNIGRLNILWDEYQKRIAQQEADKQKADEIIRILRGPNGF